ncbi:hypothetical protein HYH03_011886 [Edaphochlamys debaryana]|uniref:Uncharacterized protein n=1 Tax=Edaphochlamys debaryana TaxID=47281 RepID=A0A835XWF5_9CHLO|nr:hypothetical protein HYH03_011886 [Edaphochlamys debaryana]|eukprot:KAG2489606.1 hypothetical protein HYH03_011886 [Edaphochlamys debaryana]
MAPAWAQSPLGARSRPSHSRPVPTAAPCLPPRKLRRTVAASAAPKGAATRAAPAVPPTAPSSSASSARPAAFSLVETQGGTERDLLASTSSSPATRTPATPSPLSTADLVHGDPSGTAPSSAVLALAALPDTLKDLFLPPGFPSTVTPDYLPYQLWSMPTHITGHLSHSLVTSSLLSAVGVSAGPAATVALSASIKWIVKDGVGALGRLIVGSRFSAEFDEDPRRWRMVAEALSTAGLGLEVATVAAPQHFLLLACAGKFCQALGKGMGKPVFRVIQTHFARAQNVGAVAAKEEVWEVTAQMLGLVASVAALRALEGTGSYEAVIGSWAAVQAVHVTLRYKALTTLLFTSLSPKRTALLASAWVRGQRPLPNARAVATEEPVLGDSTSVRPHVVLGCTAAEAFGGVLPQDESALLSYARLYDNERYWLVWRDDTAHVVLKEGCDQSDWLRAMWQAAWLDHHSAKPGQGQGQEAGVAEAGPSGRNGNGTRASGEGAEALVKEAGGGPSALEVASVAALEGAGGFGEFLAALEGAGWEAGVVHMQPGKARLRVGLAA